MSAVAIIPARYASTRLPGKPLLDRTGKPLVVHVAARAAAARSIGQVIVATDDRRIFDAVTAHGYRAVMTREDHPNGTSRIAEAAETLPPDVDIIVNVQGDEPQIEPAVIDAVVERLRSGDEPIATVASPFAEGEDPTDPNIVKVVLDQRGRAMYFSRALIPHDRDHAIRRAPLAPCPPAHPLSHGPPRSMTQPPAGKPPAAPPETRNAQPYLKHIGLYAYRRSFLPIYVSLPATPAEQSESLEQLRALEHGHPIAVALATVHHHGIDTPEQYEAFVAHTSRGTGNNYRE